MRSISLLLAIAALLQTGVLLGDDRPNILWITSEDNGCELGCYGDAYATTPHLDQLAKSAMRFDNVWSNAPVCAPARTAIITGMWPPSLGASHMRSEVKMPSEFQMFPKLLRDAGYYCTNNVKEDYNVTKHEKLWNESSKKAHWRNRAKGQPFFAVFNSTLSHESQIRTQPHNLVHDPEQVDVPKYHPELPEIRRDWAQYYDKLTEMDTALGAVLEELHSDGLTDSTIIFYFGDHGSGMPRGKRWLYQSGLHVPLLISVPEKFRHLTQGNYNHGGTSNYLTSFIDLAPTVLELCNVEAPDYYQGSSIFTEQNRKERYLYGFRDRMDERYDCSRAIRDDRFLYIRNFMPHRPQGQYLEYMYQTPTTLAWLNAARDGQTNEAQTLFWKLKPAEELYDIQNDPDQINNLAGNAAFSAELTRLRDRLKAQLIAYRDLGFVPEALMQSKIADGNESTTAWSLANDNTIWPMEKIIEAAFAATSLEVDASQV